MGTKHDSLTPRFAEKIQLKPATWLKPYDRNARTHSASQLDQIAASIAEFGFVNPILAKSDGSIIAGHGRLEAATTRLGLKEVPVIILDHLTDAQARLLVLADNKIAMNAGWDEEMLAEELMALEDLGLSLDLTGFSDDELDEYLGNVEEENEMPKVQDAEEPDFQQITFTLHKDQMKIVKAAMRAAGNVGDYTDGLNENKNGNALARIAGYYNEGNREFIPRGAGKKEPPAKKPAGKKPAKGAAPKKNAVRSGKG